MSIDTSLCMPTTQILATLFDVRHVWTADFVQYLTEDTSFKHAGAASMQAAYDAAVDPKHTFEYRRLPSTKVLQHKGRALTALRNAVRKGIVTDGMLLSCLFLALNEARFGDMCAHDTHRKMLQDLVTARGGHSALGEYVHSFLLYLKFFNEMQQTQRANLPLVSHERPTYRSETNLPNLLRHSETLPFGFRALVNSGKLQADVVKVLLGINAVLHDENTATSLRFHTAFRTSRRRTSSIASLSSDSSDESNDNSSTSASSHQQHPNFFVACPSLFDAPDAAGEPSISRLLVLSLFLYVTHHLAPFAICFGTRSGPLATLTDCLLECQRQRDADEELCLIWIIWGIWESAALQSVNTQLSLDRAMRRRKLETMMSIRRQVSNIEGGDDLAHILGMFFPTRRDGVNIVRGGGGSEYF